MRGALFERASESIAESVMPPNSTGVCGRFRAQRVFTANRVWDTVAYEFAYRLESARHGKVWDNETQRGTFRLSVSIKSELQADSGNVNMCIHALAFDSQRSQ